MDIIGNSGDALNGFLGLLRQFADLIRNHGKALARFPGPCRLYRGIQRQQIGLGGNGVDRCNDIGNAVRIAVKL